MFVTSFEDGQIHRVDMGGSVTSTFDPFAADDATPGYAPLGERLWGVGVHASRVYFGRWVEDFSRRDATGSNEVWPVAAWRAGVPSAQDVLRAKLLSVGFNNGANDVT